MAEAGYSGTPLVKKLGLKDGFDALFIGLPDALAWLPALSHLRSVRHEWPEHAERQFDYIHWFGTDEGALRQVAAALFSSIRQDGSVWVSWPKKASKVPTTITEDLLRTVLLPTGLVDVKVCAVDEIWSGLKFVIRKELRAKL